MIRGRVGDGILKGVMSVVVRETKCLGERSALSQVCVK
jgi:hypothetical protein